MDAFDVAEFVLDRIVGLPDPVGQFHRRAAFALIVHDLTRNPSGALGADGHFLAPFAGAIVVIGGHADFQGICRVVGVHVKPQHVGIVFVNGLKPSGDPVVHEFDAGLIAPVGDAVKLRPLRVIQIAVQ
jgi:hypothetical protein